MAGEALFHRPTLAIENEGDRATFAGEIPLDETDFDPESPVFVSAADSADHVGVPAATFALIGGE